MNKVEKQILGAIAIGIGAGVMLNPVTAYADEGEVIPDSGSSDVNENTGSQDPVSEATSAGDSCDESAVEAYEAYSSAQDSAQQAQQQCDAIDVETSTIDEATTAQNNATELISKAEIDMAAADQAVSEAETAADIAADAIASAESHNAAINEYNAQVDTQLEEARAEENSASESYDEVEEVRDTASDEKTAADEELEAITDADVRARIIALKEELAGADKEADGYQEKVDAIGQLILDNYVIPDLEDEDKQQIEKGNLTFTFSTDENGEVVVSRHLKTWEVVDTIIHEAVEEGYYSNGEILDESKYRHVFYGDNENIKLACSDDHLFSQNTNPALEDNASHLVGEEWNTYEEVPGTEELEVVGGFTATVGNSFVTRLTVADKAEFVRVTKKIVNVPTDLGNIIEGEDKAKEYAQNFFETHKELFLQQNEGWEIDDIQYVPYSYPAEAGTLYNCDVLVLLKKVGERDGLKIWKEERIYDTITYRYKPYQPETTEEVYDWVTRSDSAIEPNVITQKLTDYASKVQAAAEKAQQLEVAQRAFDAALERLNRARDAVSTLEASYKDGLIPEEDIQNARINYSAALANLELAQSARTAAQNAIDQAKVSLTEVGSKIQQINERDEAIRLEEERKLQEIIEKAKNAGEDGTNNDVVSNNDPSSDTTDPAVRPSLINTDTATAAGLTGTSNLLVSQELRTPKARFVALSDELTKHALDELNKTKQSTEQAAPKQTVKANVTPDKSVKTTGITDDKTALAASIEEAAGKKNAAGPIGAAVGGTLAAGLLSAYLLLRKKELLLSVRHSTKK